MTRGPAVCAMDLGVRVVAAFVMLVSAGCTSSEVPAPSDGGGSEQGGPLSLAFLDASVDAPAVVQVRGILGQVCGNPDGCHGAGAGQLSIQSGSEFSSLIDVPSRQVPGLLRVKRGDPAQSYVYLKLVCEGGIDGGCMPPGAPLPPRLVQVFHEWIEAGAPTQ